MVPVTAEARTYPTLPVISGVRGKWGVGGVGTVSDELVRASDGDEGPVMADSGEG